MIYNLFEYVDSGTRLVFSRWRDDLDSSTRAKLDNKINILRTTGSSLSTGLLAGTSSGHIKKLKVQGNVKLRPRLCAGPVQDDEFSLLIGAFERDWKTIPAMADQTAVHRRLEIIDNPTVRRSPYVT